MYSIFPRHIAAEKMSVRDFQSLQPATRQALGHLSLHTRLEKYLDLFVDLFRSHMVLVASRGEDVDESFLDVSALPIVFLQEVYLYLGVGTTAFSELGHDWDFFETIYYSIFHGARVLLSLIL